MRYIVQRAFTQLLSCLEAIPVEADSPEAAIAKVERHAYDFDAVASVGDEEVVGTQDERIVSVRDDQGEEVWKGPWSQAVFDVEAQLPTYTVQDLHDAALAHTQRHLLGQDPLRLAARRLLACGDAHLRLDDAAAWTCPLPGADDPRIEPLLAGLQRGQDLLGRWQPVYVVAQSQTDTASRLLGKGWRPTYGPSESYQSWAEQKYYARALVPWLDTIATFPVANVRYAPAEGEII